MAKTSTFKTRFRRRREGKTNYQKRLALLKSGLHRLVARKTGNYVIVQLIEFRPEGDRTVVHVNSRELEGFGWKAGKKNISAAYLTGLLAGKKAKQAKIDKAILDIGFSMPAHKGWWAGVLKGAVDAGLDVPAEKEFLPSDERVSGKHIEEFAKKPEAKSAFGRVGKAFDPKQTSKLFGEVKQKIMQLK